MAQPAAPITAESLPPGDAELITASRAGDTQAYATLYERHEPSARALARHLMRGATEADDVVSEAFARVLDQLRRGGGPNDAFRPYLLTTVRRVTYDRFRAEQRQVSVPDLEDYDPGTPFVDPAVAGLEHHIIARAYFSLPQRWQAVLWHTAVEGARPAEVAELLGVTPNGAAALAYRAREGLRQAYLQMHLSGIARQQCRPVVARLGAYVRGGLSKRESGEVTAHLDRCAECKGMYVELTEVNFELRTILGPIIWGPAYFATVAALKGTGLFGWLRNAPRQHQAAVAGGAVVAVAVIAALALALTGAPPRLPSHVTPERVRPAAPPPPAHHPAASRHTHPPLTAPIPSRSVVPPSRPHTPRPVTPMPRARLMASINPVGSLLRGGTGIVTFTVADTGRTAVKSIAALITLPPGVSDLGAGTLGMAAPAATLAPGGWSCRPTMDGASCAHGALRPGETTTSYLRVAVAPDAPLGQAPSIRVNGGRRTVSARGVVGVAASGLLARFAGTGSDRSVIGFGEFGPCRRTSTVRMVLPGPVRWAGLYWAWQGSAAAAPIALAGPLGGGSKIVAADSGGQEGAHQAFADVTGYVTTGGSWTASVPRQRGVRYLGWALVVIAADPATREGQVIVLDGTRVIWPTGPAFTVPIDGLLPADRVAGMQALTWQVPGGPAIAAFNEPGATLRRVTFAPGSQPYLAGVLVVTEPPDGREYAERQPTSRNFTTLGSLGSNRLATGVGADLRVSRAEGKDGVAWIVARCSLTRAMSWRTAQWPCTGRAAVSQSPGTTVVCCSISRASPGSGRTSRCCAVTGTRRRSRGGARQTTTR